METKDLVQLAISLGGILAMLGMWRQQTRDHDRRLADVEANKVDKDVYDKDIAYLNTADGRAVNDIAKIDHRVRNMEQHGFHPRGRA